MSDKTYTEDDLKAAVAAAIEPLAAKVRELEAKDAEAETEAKIAEAVAALTEEVAEAKKALDIATAEAEKAKNELADITSFLEAEKTEAEAQAAAAERRSERVDEVKANADYKDEYIEAQADRWASMSDEEFAGLIEDLKAAGVKSSKGDADDTLPTDTKLTAASEKANKDGADSNLGAVLELRRAGIDARRI